MEVQLIRDGRMEGHDGHHRLNETKEPQANEAATENENVVDKNLEIESPQMKFLFFLTTIFESIIVGGFCQDHVKWQRRRRRRRQ